MPVPIGIAVALGGCVAGGPLPTPTPAYSPALDFSDGRNAVYLPTLW